MEDLACGDVVLAIDGFLPEDFGMVEICLSKGLEEACVEIEMAEVCEVPVEFVPEPGSILLLGSGLAGLAGYATLRWRTRE